MFGGISSEKRNKPNGVNGGFLILKPPAACKKGFGNGEAIIGWRLFSSFADDEPNDDPVE